MTTHLLTTTDCVVTVILSSSTDATVVVCWFASALHMSICHDTTILSCFCGEIRGVKGASSVLTIGVSLICCTCTTSRPGLFNPERDVITTKCHDLAASVYRMPTTL